jgi:hypothetical protein
MMDICELVGLDLDTMMASQPRPPVIVTYQEDVAIETLTTEAVNERIVAMSHGDRSRPVYKWGMYIYWSALELLQANKIGGIDGVQAMLDLRWSAMRLKWHMDLDEMAYVGDTENGLVGLINHPQATRVYLPYGRPSAARWDGKTDDEIARDIDRMLLAGGETGVDGLPNPSQDSAVLLSPAAIAKHCTTPADHDSSMSRLSWFSTTALTYRMHGKPLAFRPRKWLMTRFTGSAIMIAPGAAVLPILPLHRGPIEISADKTIISVTYHGTIGALELRNPKLLRYADDA